MSEAENDITRRKNKGLGKHRNDSDAKENGTGWTKAPKRKNRPPAGECDKQGQGNPLCIRSEREDKYPCQAASQCGKDAAEKFRGALARDATEELREEDGQERLRDMKNANNQGSEGHCKGLTPCATSGLSHLAGGMKPRCSTD